ncbi:sugar phosphate nucleotidyltransferase [Candidatus Pelagibacter sp.]|nr:sugar phosphate nucleotidyltransferase [Candidatus Pelagibacter sp.]
MKIKNFNQYIISSEETVKKAVIKLGKLKKQFCIVVDKKNKYVGTLTDGDIRRSLLLNFTLKNKIEDVCNTKSYFVRKEITENKIQEIFKLKEVPFLPIVSKLKKIIGIHYLSNYKSLDTIENEMLIMAGGKGKRLRPFTNKIPKPLLPVNGKPIIERIILIAKKQGIKNFVISVNYLGNKIKSYLKNGKKFNVNIRYINEDRPLGTAGSLYYFKNSKLPFIVSNADIISNINYREMLEYHKKLKSYITIGAISNFEKNHYGNIIFKKNRVQRIEEKVEKKSFINSGIYVVNPNINQFFKSKKFFHMTEFIESAIFKKKKIHLFPIHEYWYDYGIKDKYLKQK